MIISIDTGKTSDKAKSPFTTASKKLPTERTFLNTIETTVNTVLDAEKQTAFALQLGTDSSLPRSLSPSLPSSPSPFLFSKGFKALPGTPRCKENVKGAERQGRSHHLFEDDKILNLEDPADSSELPDTVNTSPKKRDTKSRDKN